MSQQNQDYFNSLKEGRGHLTPNKFKKSDNHPDYRGNFKMNGQIFEISGWSNTKPDGSRVMSISVQPYQQRQQQGPPQYQQQPAHHQQPQQNYQPNQQQQQYDGTRTAGPRENVW